MLGSVSRTGLMKGRFDLLKRKNEVGGVRLQKREGVVRRMSGDKGEEKSGMKEMDSGAGYQSSKQWRQQGTAGDKTRQLDMSVTWKQYSNAVVEMVLMLGCVGFAFAASLRAGHHQTVHDEDIEALNYELIEAEEEINRIKENLSQINEKLRLHALSHSRAGTTVSLNFVEDLLQQAMQPPAPTQVTSPLSLETQSEDQSSLLPSHPLLPPPTPLIHSSNRPRVLLF